ncbi:MFS transporter [Virgibacillus halophilus]|uniref:MFS transporter n=1 Tax=Tigheibacillus halophilus TaxID=361280 RepID=A0ABU5C9L0_9BACI|nr:MFS transporter [Virgibacillus halophilus]
MNKRTILFISDFSRALLIGLLLLFLWTDTVTSIHLIVLAALFGISDAFSYPALNSMVPMLLPAEHLQRGNSIIQMTGQISPILGPALGGSLIAFIGFTGVFTTALVMLFISAVTVLLIRLQEEKEVMEKTPRLC